MILSSTTLLYPPSPCELFKRPFFPLLRRIDSEYGKQRKHTLFIEPQGLKHKISFFIFSSLTLLFLMPQNGNCPRTDWLYSEEKRLICGCQVYYHFVSTERGANKVLRWTRQLVMGKSGFHFSVWFKFFIIKMFEEGEKRNQDFWHYCFQKKEPTFVLSWRTKSLPTWNRKLHSKFTLDPSKPVRHQCCPVPTPPQWQGQTSKADSILSQGARQPTPPASLGDASSSQMTPGTMPTAFKPRASLMRLQFINHNSKHVCQAQRDTNTIYFSPCS